MTETITSITAITAILASIIATVLIVANKPGQAFNVILIAIGAIIISIGGIVWEKYIG